MPTPALRPILARDGIFNARDLGGVPTRDGRYVRPNALVRADALHRAGDRSAQALAEHGVTLVLDLRDEAERAREGVLAVDGIVVEHLLVLDPHYEWYDTDAALAERYVEILDRFADRFIGGVELVAEAPGGVAYHCAVGKDRTGLLTALLLGALGVDEETIVADYARSSLAITVQATWALIYGVYDRPVTDEDLESGVWSARPDTMRATLAWLRAEHGGVEGYLTAAGLAPEVPEALRARLLVDGPPE